MEESEGENMEAEKQEEWDGQRGEEEKIDEEAEEVWETLHLCSYTGTIGTATPAAIPKRQPSIAGVLPLEESWITVISSRLYPGQRSSWTILSWPRYLKPKKPKTKPTVGRQSRRRRY